MVAPAIIAAGISGIGGLLGGILGRNSQKKAIAAQNAYNDPAAVRARFEAAGFNPLLGVMQQGVGMQSAVGGDNYIGSAIADGVSALASAWSDDANAKADNQKLQAENEELRRKVQVETIRPVVGGMYEKARGEAIDLRNSENGWIPEWEADFAGTRVKAGPFGTDAYFTKNNARTVLTTPFGDTTPANSSDAEDYEKRYGDPVSWAVGMGTLAMDAGTSLREWTNKKGWTDPNAWVGEASAKKAWDMFGLGEAKRGKDARPLKSWEQKFVLD